MKASHLSQLALGLALTCASCACQATDGVSGRRLGSVKGNGQSAERNLQLPAFHSVEAGSALNLVIHTGESQRVVVSGDSNLLDYLQAEVHGEQLELGLSGPSISLDLPLKVEIWLPAWHAVHLSGASELVAEHLKQASLEVELSGASEARIDGEVGALRANLSGASELKARACQVRKATLELSGASEGELVVLDSLEANCSGASELDVWGDPGQRNVESSGASDVNLHSSDLQ